MCVFNVLMCYFFPQNCSFSGTCFVIKFLITCIHSFSTTDTKAEIPPVSVTEHSDIQMSKCNRRPVTVCIVVCLHVYNIYAVHKFQR